MQKVKSKLPPRFEQMLKLSVQPYPPKKGKEVEGQSGGYSGKKTRLHKTANI